MGRGGQIQQAQNITQSQIDLSRQQLDQQNQYLKAQMDQRSQYLDPIYQQLAGQLPGMAQSLGLSPEAKAAMTSQAISGTPGQFDNATAALRANLTRRGLYGGANPASGVSADPLAKMAIARAQTRAGALSDITLNADALRRQGIMNAFSAGTNLAGAVSGSYNPSPFVQGADAALGSAGNATNARASLIKPGFWDYAAPVLGAGIGAVGSYMTGGMSKSGGNG